MLVDTTLSGNGVTGGVAGSAAAAFQRDNASSANVTITGNASAADGAVSKRTIRRLVRVTLLNDTLYQTPRQSGATSTIPTK